VAREIEAMLCAEPALVALPDKFGVAVDGGGLLPLAGVSADIIVRGAGDLLSVQLDDGTLGALCPRWRLVETVKALALASLRLANDRAEEPRRMRPLVHDVGEDAIFDAAGLSPTPMPSFSPPAPPSAIGFVPYPTGSEGAFGAGLPFGRIDADGLDGLAGLSERFGDGSLRTSPWRALFFAGIAACDVAIIADEIATLGLITDPSDPRLRILACVGAPSCTSATVDARADATHLAVIVGEHARDTIHVSGCAKSCAHRGPASLTLVGRDGRYDVIRNGMASDRPSLTGLRLDEIFALAGKEHP
jgi:precorrin-3B synthase